MTEKEKLYLCKNTHNTYKINKYKSDSTCFLLYMCTTFLEDFRFFPKMSSFRYIDVSIKLMNFVEIIICFLFQTVPNTMMYCLLNKEPLQIFFATRLSLVFAIKMPKPPINFPPQTRRNIWGQLGFFTGFVPTNFPKSSFIHF